MKLAEALQERADLNRKIEQLRSRLRNNALCQEGEKTAEDPGELKEELDASVARFAEITAKINLTNCRTVVDGITLTDMIARKDALTLSLSVYKEIAQAASQTVSRARNSEIRIMPAIPVREWQKQIDRMAESLRKLDNRLQESNWKTELIRAFRAGRRRFESAGNKLRPDRVHPYRYRHRYHRILTAPARVGTGTLRLFSMRMTAGPSCEGPVCRIVTVVRIPLPGARRPRPACG